MMQFLRRLFTTEQDRIEAYLAKSTSLEDLERRQRELFRHRSLF